MQFDIRHFLPTLFCYTFAAGHLIAVLLLLVYAVTSCGTTVPSEVSYRTDVTASVTETNANTD